MSTNQRSSRPVVAGCAWALGISGAKLTRALLANNAAVAVEIAVACMAMSGVAAGA